MKILKISVRFLGVVGGVFLMFNVSLGQQAIPRLNELVMKGTHNSYACTGHYDILGLGNYGNPCPLMHNPIKEQLEDWNVWMIEFDFSFTQIGSSHKMVVGHLGFPDNDDTNTIDEWGIYLKDFLEDVKASKTLEYHPIIVYFDYKLWGIDSFDNSYPDLLDDLVVEVFGESGIYSPDNLNSDSQWPLVTDLAGKIIPVANIGSTHIFGAIPRWPMADEPDKNFWKYPLYRKYNDYETSESEQANWTNGEWNILGLDNYQEDWTFNNVAPPNPIYTKKNHLVDLYGYSVTNQFGDDCDAFNDVGVSFPVSQHGTFRFPFTKISTSVDKAFPGWTLLIYPNTYLENLTISKPLTLKADGGPVIIGD